MRTGAAAGHSGFYHETAFYSSDADLLDLIVPFLRDGAGAGEPTIVALGPQNSSLAREALGDTAGITYLDPSDHHARPATTIRFFRERFQALVATGARQIRVVGDVPVSSSPVEWDAWARYEASINHVFADFPLWGLCTYDTRLTPDHVLDDVERTHPHVARCGGGHERNERFEDPETFLRDRMRSGAVPATVGTATARLHDPSPDVARQGAAAAAATAGLEPVEAENLLLVVTELTSNAHIHGRAPYSLQMWTLPGSVVVAVTDAGPGPSDALAGLVPLPGAGGIGGLGLWITHQLCDDVALRVDASGFTVCATVGSSPPA